MALRPSSRSTIGCRGHLTDLKLFCSGRKQQVVKRKGQQKTINGHWTAWTEWSNCGPNQIKKTRFRTCAMRPGKFQDWKYDCLGSNGTIGVTGITNTVLDKRALMGIQNVCLGQSF